MIKIEFSGLDFFPSTDFTDSTNVLNRILPINDLVNSINFDWNGETKPIQHVFYNAYRIKFYMRENKKQGFEKIKYAPVITITDSEYSKVYNAHFIDVQFNRINENQEFYLCELSFADKSSKTFENSFTKDNIYTLKIFKDATSYDFTTKFIPLLKNDFSQNVKNDFKNRIVDFQKFTNYYSVVLFLTFAQVATFKNIKLVGIPSDKYKIKVIDNNSNEIVSSTGEFEINAIELIGEGLTRVELRLFKDPDINYPYN